MAEKTKSEQEVDLLKTVFKDNEPLLKTMRALFFGFELDQVQKEFIRGTFQNSELRTAVRKKIYAEMGDDAPIGSVPDYWLNIQPQQIIGASRDSIYQMIQSKTKLLKMFNQGLALLEDPYGERVDLSFDSTSLGLDDLGIRLLARNLYIQAIETSLHLINQIANQPEPLKPAEVAKKQAKNSSK